MHTVHLLHLSSQLTSFIVGTFLPVLVAIVTKSTASATTKRYVLGVLSAISATVVVLATNGGTLDWPNAVLSLFITFFTALVSYLGLWTTSAGDGKVITMVKSATGKWGIGPVNPSN